LSWILRLGGIFLRVPNNSHISGRCITIECSLFHRIISPIEMPLLQTQQVFLYLLVICFQLKSWCLSASEVLTARLVLSCLFIVTLFLPAGIPNGINRRLTRRTIPFPEYNPISIILINNVIDTQECYFLRLEFNPGLLPSETVQGYKYSRVLEGMSRKGLAPAGERE
jgi:hypothetical protein